MSDERDIERGRRAQEVIDNPEFIAANALIEEEIIRVWRESKDAADREQLHALLGLQAKFKTALESVMRTGEIAAAELVRKKTLMERAKGVLR